MFPLALLRLQSILSHHTPGFSGDSVDLNGQINPQSQQSPEIDAGGMPIGNQPQQQTPPQQGDSPNQVSPYDVGNLYQPHTAITAQYSNALQNMPQRDEHPGFGRGLLGVIAGLGAGVHPAGIADGQPIGFEGNPAAAAQTADQITQRPYYTKLQDYEQKLKNLGAGATEEDRYNTNARQLAIGEVARRTAEKRAEIADAEQKSKDEKRKADVENARLRTEAYRYHQMNPQAKFQETDAGNILITHPDGSTEYMYDPESGEKVKAGKLPDEQKMIMGFQQGLARDIAAIKARGEESRRTEGVKEGYRQADIGARGEQTRQTNQDKATNSILHPQSETQGKVGDYRRAQQALLQHPEWSSWIHLDTAGANTFKIDPPNTGHVWSSGPSQDEYNKMVEYMSPTKTDIALPPPKPAAGTKPNTQIPATDNEPRTPVYDVKTGEALGTIPTSNVPRLNKEKYTTVKPKVQ